MIVVVAVVLSHRVRRVNEPISVNSLVWTVCVIFESYTLHKADPATTLQIFDFLVCCACVQYLIKEAFQHLETIEMTLEH